MITGCRDNASSNKKVNNGKSVNDVLEKQTKAEEQKEQTEEKDKKKEKGRKRDAFSAGIDREQLALWQEFEKETLVEPIFCENPASRILFGEQLYQLPEGMPDLSGLRVLRPGLHLGTIKTYLIWYWRRS